MRGIIRDVCALAVPPTLFGPVTQSLLSVMVGVCHSASCNQLGSPSLPCPPSVLHVSLEKQDALPAELPCHRGDFRSAACLQVLRFKTQMCCSGRRDPWPEQGQKTPPRRVAVRGTSAVHWVGGKAGERCLLVPCMSSPSSLRTEASSLATWNFLPPHPVTTDTAALRTTSFFFSSGFLCLRPAQDFRLIPPTPSCHQF